MGEEEKERRGGKEKSKGKILRNLKDGRGGKGKKRGEEEE
jgi:hypothetical protein